MNGSKSMGKTDKLWDDIYGLRVVEMIKL